MANKKKFGMLLILTVFALVVLNNISTSESISLLDRLLGGFNMDYQPAEPLVPENLEISPEFKEGAGPVVGNVQMVTGRVIAIHEGQSVGYELKKGHPLYNGDILVSGEQSRLNVKMADKSSFALAANTKLMIERSIYSEKKMKRDSMLNLLFGRARFIVAKIAEQSRYEVKADTSVCAVRGSDFVVSVTPAEFELTGLTGKGRLAAFFRAPEAYAAGPGTLLTTLVTGTGTTVAFTGAIGSTQMVGPTSVSAAQTGSSSIPGLFAGAQATGQILNNVGPMTGSFSMPPHDVE